MARYYAKLLAVREIPTHNATSFDPACLKSPNTPYQKTPNPPAHLPIKLRTAPAWMQYGKFQIWDTSYPTREGTARKRIPGNLSRGNYPFQYIAKVVAIQPFLTPTQQEVRICYFCCSEHLALILLRKRLKYLGALTPCINYILCLQS
jgi:hypothetical protein